MRSILVSLLLPVVFAALPATGWSQTIPGQIDAILNSVSGNTWTALVENDSGSAIYYERNSATGLAPASNTKMFTTAAAFGLLGTNYAFETRVYCDGPLNGGLLAGNLNLVCEHDMTWNTSVFTNTRAPLDHIAAQLKALGLTSVASNVQFFGVCAYSFGSTDYLNARTTQAKNAEAAAAFKAALEAQGITVLGSAVGETGFTAPGALFYTHHSSDLSYQGKPLRLDIACIPLLKVSHNVMADLLCRHLGWKLDGSDSYSAGTAQVLRWLNNSAGLSTNGMAMNDGSGLSRGNRFSARHCVSLTRYMLAAFPDWGDGLPVGCVDGTIRRRFCGTDGAGEVHAKTGSLRLSIALSGYLTNPYNHQRYLFSFIANQSPGIDQTATRKAIDDAVVLFGAPPLVEPEVSLAGNTVTFAWPTGAGLKYRVQFKDRLSDALWQTLGSDLAATNTTALKVDSTFENVPQRFYRILQVN